MRDFAALVVLVAALLSCGGDEPSVDGGGDAAGADAGTGPDIPWLADGLPPIALTPCPDGWREVADGDLATCDPYPEGGPADCGPGEAHFPGEPGCRPVGDACPAGDYAELLGGEPIVYVSPSAAPGGDGSLASPFAQLADVGWLSLAPGATVALAKGTHEGTLPLRAGVRVVGACAAETILTGIDLPVAAVVSVTNAGEPAVVRNLTIAGAPQWGARVQDGRSLTLEGVVLTGLASLALVVDGAGTTVTLTDTVVRDTRPDSAGGLGRGILVQEGGRVSATRLVVSDNRDIGVFGDGTGTELELADAAVIGTLPEVATGSSGRGITVQTAARLVASRLFLSGNHREGLYAGRAGTDVELTDAVIVDTMTPTADPTSGRGISVEEGATLSASRLRVARNYEVGVYAFGADTRVVLTDAAVTDTDAVGDGHGQGAQVASGARLDATRVLFARNREVGLAIGGAGTAVVLRDVAVLDVQPETTSDFGWGLFADLAATVTGERVSVARHHDLGVVVFGGAAVELTDVSVSDVAPWPEGLAYGVAAIGGAVRLSRFEIRAATTCGLFISPEEGVLATPGLDVDTGVVSRVTIGACIQVPDYDLSRITREVRYTDNEQNLDTTSLPVPEPLGAIAP